MVNCAGKLATRCEKLSALEQWLSTDGETPIFFVTQTTARPMPIDDGVYHFYRATNIWIAE